MVLPQPGPPIAARMVDIPAGTATLGIPRGRESFGWDNEFEDQSVQVPAFAMDAHKVTNGEFLQFVREGGYDDQRFWSDADWAWIKEQNIRHPRFWLERQGQWFYRAMFEEVPLPLDWPVYRQPCGGRGLRAFCRQVPSYRSPVPSRRLRDAGRRWSESIPGVTRPPKLGMVTSISSIGIRSPWGAIPAAVALSEWRTLSETVGSGPPPVFAPFPGFEPFPFYPGYSANFFDGKHYVMKGASPRTGACMLRRSFRNWFQPHYPFVYASFRCVSN